MYGQTKETETDKSGLRRPVSRSSNLLRADGICQDPVAGAKNVSGKKKN